MVLVGLARLAGDEAVGHLRVARVLDVVEGGVVVAVLAAVEHDGPGVGGQRGHEGEEEGGWMHGWLGSSVREGSDSRMEEGFLPMEGKGCRGVCGVGRKLCRSSVLIECRFKVGGDSHLDLA